VINPSPILTITNPAAVCDPNTVDLTSSSVTAGSTNVGTLTYWTDANATIALSNPSTVSASGTYYIQASTTLCSDIEPVVATINPIPAAPAAGVDATYCSTWPIVPISATGNAAYTWYADPALAIVIGNQAGYIPANTIGTSVYYVTQTVLGCEGPATAVTITIQNCEIIVPTAFTPDGDNVNDYWEIPDLDYVYPNNKVFVYNRWGNLLYESEEGKYANAPWKGDFKGSKMPVGSYYYIIEMNDAEDRVEKGIVTIVLEKEN
jgi:gliding motility-associated-like protein